MHAAVRQSLGQVITTKDEAEMPRPARWNCDAAEPALVAAPPRRAVLDAIDNESETIGATLRMADYRPDPIFAPGHPASNQAMAQANNSTTTGLGACGPSAGTTSLKQAEINRFERYGDLSDEDAPVLVPNPEPLERSSGRPSRGAWRDRVLHSKVSKAAGVDMEADAGSRGEVKDLTLVVIAGLPGLGKSVFFKRLAVALAAPGRAELRRRVCAVSKDALSLELEADVYRCRPGAKPSRDDVLRLVLARVGKVAAADPGHVVLMYNMNINVDWFAALVARLGSGGFTLRKVVVLTPSAEIPFRRLHAAAIVLACDVRTGLEPPDEASTLPPDKAWAVLSTGYFSTPNAVATVAALHAVAPNADFAEVQYPVPLLQEHVPVGERVPEVRPAEWNRANLVFPSDSETERAVEAVLTQVG